MEPTARVLFAMSVIEVMSQDERAAFLDLYRDKYCDACGREDSGCPCMRDE